MTSARRLRLAAGFVAATSIAWLDPHQPLRDANRLYAEGKYAEAGAGYNAALVDHPDSPELHFNLGDAAFKQGKYDEALAAYQKVETASDPARASRVAYNVGNATFRKGQALEQSEPQKALQLYGEALASYRRALGLAPGDADVKFNHEFVTKRIDEVQQRLEEQEQQQDQQQQNQDQPQDQQQQGDQQQEEQQGPDQPPQDEAGDPQEQPQQPDEDGQDQQQPQHAGEQNEQDEPQEPADERQAGEQQNAEPQPGEPQQQQPPTGEAYADEKKDGELSRGEAAAILDSQRGEEVSPEDVIKQLQGARVAEPSQDW